MANQQGDEQGGINHAPTNGQITMYGASWCPDCRRSKQFLGEQRIKYNWVDLEQQPEAAEIVQRLQNGRQSIPTIVFPDGSVLVEPSNAELARKLGISTKAKCPFYDVIIIGGGPTGLSAAIYTARDGLDTLLIERAAIGGQAGITECVDNYPGFPDGVSGDDFAARMKQQAARFGVEMLEAQEVTNIARDGGYLVISTAAGDEYTAAAALIATGSNYKRLGVENETEFTGAGVHYCATCDGPFYKGREVAVVGGGNSAAEEGAFLLRFASKVTLLVRGDHLEASKVAQDKVDDLVKAGRMAVRYNSEVVALRGKHRLETTVIHDRITGAEQEITPAALFVFIGLSPNSGFLKQAAHHDDAHQPVQVALDAGGFVATDAQFATNVPGLFAAGDVRTGSTKQIASAVGEGATAALMIREYLKSERG
ncbi:MAG: pyridine nucleotide-disulfide oxidoreductase [Candidatus Chloroheliales bacterium]|nr:MAG: pyridine nucleotide-disulfide oxidoreductase [Chloroflexota bacterium]